ncbi:hypothetical protein SmJEL517_g05383 [Synchytrium microbalum]|uniref:RING-type domain-containing protein n=1 Tax=Synchytrium microbalum TaxID=1806994 RepID=A0A507BUK7_9FUNG|nr:uncharacterized protein SmJEL517_g05383 [Synchytrium microbalum]TPX31242.1 hypothetical protein SmJEL517_g05383 [Synchytrium microbalum]
MRHWILALVLLAAQQCSATVRVLSSVANETFTDRNGAFGVKNTGNVIGYLIAASSLSSDRNEGGCMPVESPILDVPEFGWVALVQRGECSFVEKVRSMMRSGAKAVIVGDNQPGDLITMYSQEDTSDVIIPSVFISMSSYRDLRFLSQFTEKNSGLQLQKHGRIPHLLVELEKNENDIPLVDLILIAVLSPLSIVFCLCGLWQIIVHRRRRQQAAVAPQSTRQTVGNEEFITNLPIRKYNKKVADDGDSDDEDVCAICLDDYEDDEELRILPCFHEFHVKCIDPWLLTRSSTCPSCKAEIAPEPTETTPLLDVITEEVTVPLSVVESTGPLSSSSSIVPSMSSVSCRDAFWVWDMLRAFKLGKRAFSTVSAVSAAKESVASHPFIGDLVEIRRRGRTYQGVIAGVDSHGYKSILINGQLLSHSKKEISYRSEKWVFSSSVQKNRIVSPPPSLDAKVLVDQNSLPIWLPGSMAAFRKAVDQTTVNHSVRFKQVYAHFRNLKEDIVSVDEVAEFVFGENGPTNLVKHYASHVYLSRSFGTFAPIPNTSNFSILNTSEQGILTHLGNITSTPLTPHQLPMSRNQHPDLKAFLDKAKILIKWSRSRNQANLSEPPPAITFTMEDHPLISALVTYATSTVENDRAIYGRALDRGVFQPLEPEFYPRMRRDHTLAALLLKEIGVWMPWESGHVFRGWNGLSPLEGLEGTGNSSWADPCWDIMQQYGKELVSPNEIRKSDDRVASIPDSITDNFKASRPTDSSNLKDVAEMLRNIVVTSKEPTDLTFFETDPALSIRHDFGDMPVFVIDDPLAHELDDGISIETTINKERWIHIHIADPSAYVPPNSLVAMIAQARSTSVYIPEKAYTMFPQSLSTERWDLRSGKVCPALTFSAKLDSYGDILDIQVRASLLRNIKVISYDDADKILSWEEVHQFKSRERDPLVDFYLQKNLTRASKPFDGQLDQVERENLLEIQRAVLSHHSERVRQGSLQGTQLDLDIRLLPSDLNLPSSQSGRPDRPIYPTIFPTIRLKTNVLGLSPSHSLVSESMVLAGRIAAIFCTQANLAIPYRGQQNPLNVESSIGTTPEFKSQIIDSALNNRDPVSGLVTRASYDALAHHLPPAETSLQPQSHFAMGLRGQDSPSGGYLKVTSPLRRYMDLLVHYQIKSVLCKSDAYPMMSPQDVMIIMERARGIERAARQLSTRSQRCWGLEWVRRRECRNIDQGANVDGSGVGVIEGDDDDETMQMQDPVEYSPYHALSPKLAGRPYRAMIIGHLEYGVVRVRLLDVGGIVGIVVLNPILPIDTTILPAAFLYLKMKLFGCKKASSHNKAHHSKPQTSTPFWVRSLAITDETSKENVKSDDDIDELILMGTNSVSSSIVGSPKLVDDQLPQQARSPVSSIAKTPFVVESNMFARIPISGGNTILSDTTLESSDSSTLVDDVAKQILSITTTFLVDIVYTEKCSPTANVIVTGPFDNFSKTLVMERNEAGKHHLTIQVNGANKIFFKFLVDEKWKLSKKFAVEEDGTTGNLMNVIDISCPMQVSSPAHSAQTKDIPVSPNQTATPTINEEDNKDGENDNDDSKSIVSCGSSLIPSDASESETELPVKRGPGHSRPTSIVSAVEPQAKAVARPISLPSASRISLLKPDQLVSRGSKAPPTPSPALPRASYASHRKSQPLVNRNSLIDLAEQRRDMNRIMNRNSGGPLLGHVDPNVGKPTFETGLMGQISQQEIDRENRKSAMVNRMSARPQSMTAPPPQFPYTHGPSPQFPYNHAPGLQGSYYGNPNVLPVPQPAYAMSYVPYADDAANDMSETASAIGRQELKNEWLQRERAKNADQSPANMARISVGSSKGIPSQGIPSRLSQQPTTLPSRKSAIMLTHPRIPSDESGTTESSTTEDSDSEDDEEDIPLAIVSASRNDSKTASVVASSSPSAGNKQSLYNRSSPELSQQNSSGASSSAVLVSSKSSTTQPSGAVMDDLMDGFISKKLYLLAHQTVPRVEMYACFIKHVCEADANSTGVPSITEFEASLEENGFSKRVKEGNKDMAVKNVEVEPKTPIDEDIKSSGWFVRDLHVLNVYYSVSDTKFTNIKKQPLADVADYWKNELVA